MINMNLLTNTSNTTHPTYNISNEKADEEDNMFNEVMKCISTIILIGILVANTLVIGLLFFRQKRKSRMGFFVTNLALADLAVGIFYVLPETLFNWYKATWPHEYFCYFFYAYFANVAYYSSTYAIVVVTLDRLYVIVRPLAAAAKGKMYRYGLSLSAWVIGLLLGIQYAYHIEYNEPNNKCEPYFPYQKGILYFDLFLILVIPLAIITVCYVIIIITIWNRERYGFVIAKTQNTRKPGGADLHATNKVISSAKIKTVKLLFVVVVAYTLSWTPFVSAGFLLLYGVIDFWEKSEREIYLALYVLAPLNSLVNPLVFLIFNRKMFCKKKPRQVINAGLHTEQVRLTTEQK